MTRTLPRPPATAGAIDVRSAADFRRFLATPGATLQLIRPDNATTLWDRLPDDHPRWKPAPVLMVRSKDFILNRGTPEAPAKSYCDHPTAKQGRFEGDKVTIRLSDPDSDRNDVLIYRLTISVGDRL